MPKKRRVNDKPRSVEVGNVSDISGNVNIAGGNITTHQNTTSLSSAEITRRFDELYAVIDTNAEVLTSIREDVKTDVKEIQAKVTEAVQSGNKLEESFLARRFRNIARMAPEILDVVVTSLANPLAGLGIAVKKIAEKAKEETKQG